MMKLRVLVEKTPDADLLREMIGFAAQRLMELEVGALTGASYSEKSAGRLDQGTLMSAGAPATRSGESDAWSRNPRNIHRSQSGRLKSRRPRRWRSSSPST